MSKVKIRIGRDVHTLSISPKIAKLYETHLELAKKNLFNRTGILLEDSPEDLFDLLRVINKFRKSKSPKNELRLYFYDLCLYLAITENELIFKEGVVCRNESNWLPLVFLNFPEQPYVYDPFIVIERALLSGTDWLDTLEITEGFKMAEIIPGCIPPLFHAPFNSDDIYKILN